MEQTKKTAILLYGYTRTYKTTAKSLLKNVAEPNDADIFVYCWDNEGVSNVKTNANTFEINNYKNKMSCKEDSQGKEVTTKTLENVYGERLKKCSIQKYDNTKFKNDSEGVPSPILPIERMFSLYYNITGVMKLLIKYEQENNIRYDNIILARPDLEFYSKIDLKNYNLNLLNIANYGGNINPNGKNELYYTCYYKNVERVEYIPSNEIAFSDQLIISKHENLEKLCNLYDMLKEYNQRNVPVCHPETVLYYHLALLQNIEVATNNIKYEILRNNFSRSENSFSLLKTNKTPSKTEKYKNKIKQNLKEFIFGLKAIIGIFINLIKYAIAAIRGGGKTLTVQGF